MEDIHGVDVSWLHHSTRDHHHRTHAPSSPGLTRDAPPRTSAHGGLPHDAHYEARKPIERAPAVQEVSMPTSPIPIPSPTSKTPPKRPGLLSRGSSERNGALTPPDSKSGLRRGSWISNISSKFSSQNAPPAQTTHAQAQGSPATAPSTTSSANGALNGIQAATNGSQSGPEHYVPQPPKSSFISNALRRLSSGTQVGSMGKVVPNGGVCPRKVLNVDPNRERCLVPELDQSKLRRVAFSVDVEIAGGPRYKDDADEEDRKKKRKERKLKERGEGEALKRPDLLVQEKEQEGAVKINGHAEVVGNEDAPNPEGTVLEDDRKEPSKKKEKKKRSEAERKERKEKKRRKAEENGTIPLELTRDEDEGGPDTTPSAEVEKKPPRPQGRPTTDPLRIYRRCCQLRETPILKRICDQLAAPQACALTAPGVVTCLDLTGSRLQLADVVTLSDWLAIVPVKKLFLEDADLNDEKVRVILAGLLAAKIQEPPKRRLSQQEKPASNGTAQSNERSGIIKKLVLKNNIKITGEGWKHISLFTYMCKSIQALDVSMIPFPRPTPELSQQISNESEVSTVSVPPRRKDVGDILSKAISERLAGSHLEELIFGECNLTAPTIRKIIDAVIISGVNRLGLAGNEIDSEGVDHIIHYIRSGVCQGIDLGGNDIRDSIPRISQALTKDCPLWALSLADCDLTPESIKPLFPALCSLPSLRFLDFSRNKDLFSHKTSLCMLRKYLPHMQGLKRIHLADVNLSPEGAIGIAEVIPECKDIAHINILDNPKINAVSSSTDEAGQEEAAALYASFMAAAKLSHTLICVDVDVPGPDAGEVVRALAKQVVAYCLRNMESFSQIPELKPEPKEVHVPDVLMHVVGHSEGFSENHDNDPPAPNDDYIVTGTGVVKALSYCLLQKATDLRRASLAPSGTTTPRNKVEDEEDVLKAKTTSKYLLGSARNIKARLQPALLREARAGNDMGYRKLLFLDQTLQGMIQRFEDEYPETRLSPADASSVHSSTPSTSPSALTVPTLSTTTDAAANDSDDDEPKVLRSRHNSDVSLASRNLSLEEGRLHRLGHRIRTELLNPSRPTSAHGDDLGDDSHVSGSQDHFNLPEHLQALREKYMTYSGEEIRDMTEQVGIEKAFDSIIENAEELRKLKEDSPEEFKLFRATQIAALKNRSPGAPMKDPLESKAVDDNEFAVED